MEEKLGNQNKYFTLKTLTPLLSSSIAWSSSIFAMTTINVSIAGKAALWSSLFRELHHLTNHWNTWVQSSKSWVENLAPCVWMSSRAAGEKKQKNSSHDSMFISNSLSMLLTSVSKITIKSKKVCVCRVLAFYTFPLNEPDDTS